MIRNCIKTHSKKFFYSINRFIELNISFIMSAQKNSFSFIFIFIIIFSSFSKINGKPPRKVVGGSNASIYEFPGVVSIQLYDAHLCGGVFITMRHILTASHCLAYEDQSYNIKLFDLNDMTVASGSVNSVKKQQRNVHQIEELILHPNYKGTHDWHGNDIGIIKLVKAVQQDATHQIVKLPSAYCRDNLYATVLGWGFLYADSGSTSEILKKAPVVTMSNENCQKLIPYGINDDHLCGLYSKGIGFCDGDSGGPLLIHGEIVGVVSMGYKCGSGMPDIYTRVHSYVPWIKSVIKNN